MTRELCQRLKIARDPTQFRHKATGNKMLIAGHGLVIMQKIALFIDTGDIPVPDLGMNDRNGLWRDLGPPVPDRAGLNQGR
tara:strand:- start:7776 stop:8018 length:243 start_codon:yes stop_codon:yes gene_type:complete